VIASNAGQHIVWDVQPVPAFRNAMPIAGASVAGAIAQAVARRLPVAVPGLAADGNSAWIPIRREGIRGGVVVSA
jgi:hypothetical protein